MDGYLTALLQSIFSPSLASITFDLNEYEVYVNPQDQADPSLWSETDAILADLTDQSTGKLGLQVRSSRWKTLDWQVLLPRFKEHGILERVHSSSYSESHPLSPHFDSPEHLRVHYVAENAYWKTVDRVHHRIEAETIIRKLDGSKNRTTDSSLAEKIRRRNVKKKKREITRSV